MTRSRLPRVGLYVCLPVLALSALGGAADHARGLFLVNESPSLPEGLYVRTADRRPDRGAVVAVPQPPVAQAYLGPLGMPAEVLLLKRVAAVGGDVVCSDEAAVRWPGGRAPVGAVDRRGRPLPRWAGCRRLAADELFLLGDTPASFDSRHFGPVSRSAVAGVYREMVRW